MTVDADGHHETWSLRRADDVAELDGVELHPAHSRSALRWRGSLGLLLGLEHLDRDAVRVVDGDEVRAHEPGSALEHGDELLVERARRLGLIVNVHMDNGRMHDRPLSACLRRGHIRCSTTVVIDASVKPMGEPVKRPYRSPLREQAAQRTRTQIRDAAAQLFAEQGYALTTMRQIAENAEVSERTAYLAFPSKLDLFMGVIGVATAGDDQPIPIAQRPEFQAALSERDGKKALGLV